MRQTIWQKGGVRTPNHLVLKFAVRTMSDDADSMNFDWLDTGQLPALPVLFDDEHVELLPVTEEGDDRETGSPSLVTTPPSASPASALRAEVASVARAIAR